MARTPGNWIRFRKKFLKDKINFQGYYVCEHCYGWFKHIEVDHMLKRSTHPELIYNEDNLQLLCHRCHLIKDSGMRVLDTP